MRLFKYAALAIASLLYPVFAFGATLTFTSLSYAPEVRYLTGALNVDVNGTFYDVSFLRGKPMDIYGVQGTPSYRPLDFSTRSEALAAGQALLDQVFLDVPGGARDELFDTYRDNTAYLPVGFDGSAMQSRVPRGNDPYREDRDSTNLLIPYILDGSVPAPYFGMRVYNSADELQDRVVDGTFFGSSVENWAIFTASATQPAPVPLPAPALLLGFALGGLGVLRLRG